MTAWDNAATHILHVEGGLTNNKNDPGQITNFGISLRFLHDQGLDLDGDGDIDADDVRGLTPEKAIELYQRFFWKPYGYDCFSDAISLKLFDMTVNMGPGQSHRLIQKALWGYGYHLEIDGKLGPHSVQAIQAVCFPMGGELGLLAATRTAQRCFYEGLIIAKPPLQEFLNGWVNRTYSC